MKEDVFMGNTESQKVQNITICCMSQEARDFLDLIMKKWEKHYLELKKNDPDYEPGHYGFAYWLVRWSGLIDCKKGIINFEKSLDSSG